MQYTPEGTAEHALLLAMAATLESLGQCMLATPYGQVRAVLTNDGLRFCCDHSEQHCSAVVAGLE